MSARPPVSVAPAEATIAAAGRRGRVRGSGYSRRMDARAPQPSVLVSDPSYGPGLHPEDAETAPVDTGQAYPAGPPVETPLRVRTGEEPGIGFHVPAPSHG